MKKDYGKALSYGKEYLDWLRKNPGRKPLAVIKEEGRILSRSKLTEEQLKEVKIASNYYDSLVKIFVDDRSNKLIEYVPDEYKDEMKKVVEGIRNSLEIIKAIENEQRQKIKEFSKLKEINELLKYFKMWLEKNKKIPEKNKEKSPERKMEDRLARKLEELKIWNMIYKTDPVPEHLENLLDEIRKIVESVKEKEAKKTENTQKSKEPEEPEEAQKPEKTEGHRRKKMSNVEFYLTYLFDWLKKYRYVPEKFPSEKDDSQKGPEEKLGPKFASELEKYRIWDIINGTEKPPKGLEDLVERIKKELDKIQQRKGPEKEER